ncbi:DUF2935 domain-containing protein [Irregularibacter muris]|uniref:DUF2935 domain-containing protein n=1 Tax=Irregularibacter muris TaxID=1796619 RepID=A0AAE3HF60_9FIRM|nr:DUF2935 domain-containing protein [Irregularibacter muris]MCR1899466.1 DUF2935 domain-containing protein [Irregularibacter muris]
MQFCYGDKNYIRILEEAEFWKTQESEHTVVIREVVENLEKKYVEILEDYQATLGAMEATVVQYIERLGRSNYMLTPRLIQEINQLIEATLCQSQMFVNFLASMTLESTAVKSNPTAVIVVAHIIRESEYYIGVAKAYLSYVSYRLE